MQEDSGIQAQSQVAEPEADASKVQFKLTTQMKKQIFAEDPDLWATFKETVPSKTSEKDFWTRLFRSKRGQKIREMASKWHSPASKQTQLLYPDTNIEGGDEARSVSHRGGYGLLLPDSGKGTLMSGLVTLAREVVEQYNVHGKSALSSAALAQQIEEQFRNDARRSWVQLPDLEPSQPKAYQPLPPRLTASATATGEPARGKRSAEQLEPSEYEALARRVSARFAEASARLKTASLACASREDAHEAARELAPPLRASKDAALAMRPLAKDEAELIKAKMDRTIELLRFFYACFPLTQPEAADRASSIRQAIDELKSEIDKLQMALPRNQPDVVKPILAQFNAIRRLLTTAVQRHDEGMKKFKLQTSSSAK